MINKQEKKYLKNLIVKYGQKKTSSKIVYPLVSKAFKTEDIIAGADILLNGKITMSQITKKFEKEFAKYLGVKYALMVNSGSSANLLSFFASINPKNKKKNKTW